MLQTVARTARKAGYHMQTQRCADRKNFKRLSRLAYMIVRVSKDRGGFGISDTGINGFLAGLQRNRRKEIHEEAKT